MKSPLKKVLKTIVTPPARVAMRGLSRVFQDVTLSDGHSYRFNANIHPLDFFNLVRGKYEKDERAMMHKFFTPDSTILEIGANIGIVSVTAFEEKLIDGGRMICVEPDPNVLGPLRHNMQRAQLRHPAREFKIIARAVTPEGEGQSRFRQRDSLSSGLEGVVKPRRRDRTITVPTTSLTDLVNIHAPQGASLICDAEGAEIDMVLKEPSAFNTIRQIVIELHEPRLTGRPDLPPAAMALQIEKLGFVRQAQAGNTYYFNRPVI